MKIECPHCQVRWNGDVGDDDADCLADGAILSCPECGAEIAITMTWTRPDYPDEQEQVA